MVAQHNKFLYKGGMTALEKALEHFKTCSNLARAVGVKYQAVQQWKRIPPRHAMKLEALTEGYVTAKEILEEMSA